MARTRRSKSAILYEQIGRSLQSGRYLPGARIDPAALAREFKSSLTPVRDALHRLVGEGVVDDPVHEGFRVPLVTAQELSELYDCMERLLHWACDLLADTGLQAPTQLDLSELASHGGLVVQTHELFERIALETGHGRLGYLVGLGNGWLGPVRRAKQGLFHDAFDELSGLYRLWDARDLPALRQALAAYHERRRRAASRIVALVNQAAVQPRY